MNGKRNALLIFCTLLLVLSGAAMPRMVSAWQDRRLETQSDSRELDGVQLVLRGDSTVEQVLSLLAGGYTKIEWTRETQLTVQEAWQAAEEALSWMARMLILPVFDEAEAENSISYFLAVSNVDGDSAVIWECSWNGKGRPSLTIRIDDATGKMVGFSCAAGAPTSMDANGSAPKENMKKDAFTVALEVPEEPYQEEYIKKRLATASMWADFLREYYGFETVQVHAEFNDGESGIFRLELKSAEADEENGGTEKNVEKERAQPPLILRETTVSFNF